MSSMEFFNCPKCNRTLSKSGEAVVGQEVLPIFQCDECLVHADIMGVVIEVALTFAVDRSGHAFDPATTDGKLPI